MKQLKISKNYLYPSFDTIAGSGPNGAVIHYRSDRFSNRELKKDDLLNIVRNFKIETETPLKKY